MKKEETKKAGFFGSLPDWAWPVLILGGAWLLSKGGLFGAGDEEAGDDGDDSDDDLETYWSELSPEARHEFLEEHRGEVIDAEFREVDEDEAELSA